MIYQVPEGVLSPDCMLQKCGYQVLPTSSMMFPLKLVEGCPSNWINPYWNYDCLPFQKNLKGFFYYKDFFTYFLKVKYKYSNTIYYLLSYLTKNLSHKFNSDFSFFSNSNLRLSIIYSFVIQFLWISSYAVNEWLPLTVICNHLYFIHCCNSKILLWRQYPRSNAEFKGFKLGKRIQINRNVSKAYLKIGYQKRYI